MPYFYKNCWNVSISQTVQRCRIRMPATPYRPLQKTAWILLAALSVLTGLYPALYFITDMSAALLSTKSATLLADEVWQAGFYSHITFGGICLLVGWIQFNPKWRDANLALHRRIGKIYVACALISAVSGIYIGFYATGGVIASLGFIALGSIWLLTTWFAYQYVKKGDTERHRRLMYYSYAACFAAVTLRLWMPLLIFMTGNFLQAYQIVAWLCWVPNIGVAFLLNRK